MTFQDAGNDIDSYLNSPVSLIVFGDPGVGKSTAVAQIASNCLWVVSSKKELRGYASFLKQRKVEAETLRTSGQPLSPDLERDIARTMPKKVLEISEFMKPAAGADPKDGMSARVSNEQIIPVIVNAYLKRLADDPNYYAGIVFSCWSVIAKRIHDDMIQRMGQGWDAGREIHKLHRWLMREIPQTSGKSLILDCHKREPDYNKSGILTTLGGPLFPTGPLGKPVAGEADFVLEYKKESVESGDRASGTYLKTDRRVWLTEGDDETIRKRRDFRIQPIEHGTLEEVLAKADVTIS